MSSLLLRRLVCRELKTLFLVCQCSLHCCSCPPTCVTRVLLLCCSLMGVVGATLNKVGRTAHTRLNMDGGPCTLVM